MPEDKLVELIVTDTSVTLPLILSYEGKEYKLDPKGRVPKPFADKLLRHGIYAEYNPKDTLHKKLFDEKDTLFMSRKDYGKFELLREFEKLSPSNRDKVIALVNSLLNPEIELKGATDPITDPKLKAQDLPKSKEDNKPDNS